MIIVIVIVIVNSCSVKHGLPWTACFLCGACVLTCDVFAVFVFLGCGAGARLSELSGNERCGACCERFEDQHGVGIAVLCVQEPIAVKLSVMLWPIWKKTRTTTNTKRWNLFSRETLPVRKECWRNLRERRGSSEAQRLRYLVWRGCDGVSAGVASCSTEQRGE